MNTLANILVADAGRPRAEILRDRLAALGYGATLAATAAEARALAQAAPPDLVMIGALPGEGALELGAELKTAAATADMSVLLFADTPSEEMIRSALAAGLDDVLATGCQDLELQARLRPLVRLSTMRTELGERVRAAARFGLDHPPRAASSPMAGRPLILIAGDNAGAVAPALEDVADLVVVPTLFEAEDALTARDFDAVLLPVRGSIDQMAGFCAQIRHNPRLFNLPLVVLGTETLSAGDAYRHGASRVIALPVQAETIRAAALALVRRQRLRWSLRRSLADTLVPATGDMDSGAYSHAFLDAYLGPRQTLATASHRHLTLALLSVPCVESMRARFGETAARHLVGQIGHWIGGLVRAEDLVARIQPQEFCVVLPDTPLAEASIAIHRIAGVLAYTDFAIPDVYQPVKAWTEVGLVEARAGEEPPALLDRVRRAFG